MESTIDNETLKKRHFRLKLYEYCFRIIYANHPLTKCTKSKSLLRSRSLGDMQLPKRQNQRKLSSLSLENGMDLALLYELNRRRMIKRTSKREINNKLQKESNPVDLWIEKSRSNAKNVVGNVVRSRFNKGNKLKLPKEPNDVWIDDVATSKEVPKFKYLKRSSPSIRIKKRVKEPTEDKYLDELHNDVKRDAKGSTKLNKSIHKTTVHLMKVNDYSKRFSSIPVISQRQSTLLKRRNKVEREIEADRRALKEFAVDHKKNKIEVKNLKIISQKTSVDTARSWISEKGTEERDAELDQVVDENSVNFERSWSAWSLKKAEMLEWDPDFDYQPVGPQLKSIRQKYYKNALIKESNDIENKRRIALNNTMIFAQIRSEQIMKSSSSLVNPTKTKKLTLPVDKLIKNEDIVKQQSKQEHRDEEIETKKDDGKISIFAQIKKALHTVPEKIKEMLSFGGGDKHENEVEDKPKLERSHSITNAELDQPSRDIDVITKGSKRPSSAGDRKKCSKNHPKIYGKLDTSIDLHKHNQQVETTLGNVLILKTKQPNPEVIDAKSTESTKVPSKIAKTTSLKRHPISWRSTEDTDKLTLIKKGFKQKRHNSLKLPKIITSDAKDEHDQKRFSLDKSKLPPIPKQTELFDPIGNPYRSAGRKYSPIPSAGLLPSRSFNPEIGRCKVIDYIEQNWEYKKPSLTYRVEHYHASNIENNRQRFKYRVCWNSNKSKQDGVVFFNVDVSRIETSEPIELSYRFLGQQKTHRAKFSPTALPYRKRWLRSLSEGYELPH